MPVTTGRRYVLAPDSFKGTLSSAEVCDLLAAVIAEHDPTASVTKVPVADGGEGLVDAFLAVTGDRGRTVDARVTGPLFAPVDAFFGLLDDDTAIVEMAAAAGLPIVAADERDPTRTTTLGVGELVSHAIRAGARRIVVGLGGSATNDGGLGLAQAFGYRFLDAAGAELPPTGGSLARIARIVPPPTSPLPAGVGVEAACDVNNPLTGREGAAYIFGPQKGADPAMVAALDAGLENLADRIAADLGVDVRGLPGGGAAGGLGAGLVAFLGATLRPGIDLLLDAVGFDAIVADADWVITGEGRMDGQSLAGKTPVGVALRAQAHGVRVVGIAGSLGPGAEALYDVGFTALFSTVPGVAPLDEVLAHAADNLTRVATAVVRLLAAR